MDTHAHGAQPDQPDLLGEPHRPAKPPKPPTLYPIPATSRKARCSGEHCDAVVYWVEGRRFPISADHPKCFHPNTGADLPVEYAALMGPSDGLGVSHYVNCPDAKSFSGRRRGR